MSGSTVEAEDWYARELGAERYEQTAFVDVDLTESTTRGASFVDCSFVGALFNASTHVGSAFTNCSFRRCTFFDATFEGCKLVGSTFERCTFNLLKVTGGDWSFVSLVGADLRHAAFEGTRMREDDLARARLEGARFKRIDLLGASLRAARLDRCDLRGSDLSTLDPRDAQLADAIITLDQAVTVAQALGLDVRAEIDD